MAVPVASLLAEERNAGGVWGSGVTDEVVDGVDALLGGDGIQKSLPRAWTSEADSDVFVEMAAGRCPFRVEDLLMLACHGRHCVMVPWV
jgi:hypothetical protein